MPPALKGFLDECKSRGISVDEAITGLQGAGWTVDQLQMARQYYSGNPSPLPDLPVSSPSPNITSHKKNTFAIVASILLLFFILFSGIGVSAYFVAIEKIPLSNLTLKNSISSVVFSLPFIPKSPRFLLTRAAAAHQTLSRNSFDLSLATTSNDFRSLLGTDKFDLRFAGYTDFTDTKNPKFSINVDWAKDFSARTLKPGQLIYFKIDKLPLLATAYLGIEQSQANSILENWIVYDPTPLETEARKNIISNSTADSPINQTTQKLLIQLMDEEILPFIKISSDPVDNYPSHKLVYQPTSTQLDRIYTKISQGLGDTGVLPKSDISLRSKEILPSEYIKNITVSVWVDQKDYYIRKAVVSFNLHANDSLYPSISLTDASFALALKLADFGKSLPIDTPVKSIKPEDFYALVTQSSSMLQSRTIETQNVLLDRDMMTLVSAVEQYRAGNKGAIPSKLSLLTPKYLSQLPDSVTTQKLTLKINQAQNKYLIYSQVPDSTYSVAPYRGWDSTFRHSKLYSQAEITAF